MYEYEGLVKTLRENTPNRRLMFTAADAIEKLAKESERWQVEAKNWYLAYMDLLPTRWIPVTERLPDVFKHILVNIPGMAPHPTVQEAFREKNGMWYSNGFRYGTDEITHWMPLPSQPVEEI